MSTMMRYDRAGILERLTSNTLFTVLLGIAATVLVPVILYSFTQFTQCVLLGIMLIGAVPWEILGMLLLPIGGMVGYVGLFQARRPATSSADYWATLTCLGVGIAAAGTVIGELLTIDIDYRVVAGFIVVLSLLIVAALGRIVRLQRRRAAARAK